MCLAGNDCDMGERGRVGSAQPSLLRLSILVVGAAALGACLLATASPASAGGLSPDPPPTTDIRPDAYPTPRARAAAPLVAPTPARVTRVVVVHSSTTVMAPRTPPAKAAPHHRRVAPTHARAEPKPQRPLPFPTLAIKWFSGTAVPAAARSREVPARVALILAALFLASAALVAGVAREAAR